MPLPSVRSTVLTLGAVAIALPSAFAAPDDPFTVALPGHDTQSPEGLKGAHQGQVSETDGSASFSFPIEVPPSRNGMAPSLALSYSSSSSLRGGIAAGWSLALPTIERDPAYDAPIYRMRLGGASQRLVEVTGDPGGGTRYRPARDEGSTRVARDGAVWTVQTPDGVTRTFSGASSSSDASTIWNLTNERDSHGNEVVYIWANVTLGDYVEYLPTRVEYTSNAAAGLAAHAKLTFDWAAFELCPNAALPKGAQSDHHFGRKLMSGSKRLASLETSVRDTPGGTWRAARRTTLTYDAAQLGCGMDRPTLRYITQIDSTAWSPSGVATSAPPLRFGYGPAKRDLTHQTWTMAGPRGLGDYGTRKGPESTLMDFDGDGINDQVRVLPPPIVRDHRNDPHPNRCRLLYRRGFYGGGFDDVEREAPLPTADWYRGGNPVELESCTLNGQHAWRPMYKGSSANWCEIRDVQISYQFIDWDHDGDRDLVTAAWHMGSALALGGDFPPPLIPTSGNNDETVCQAGETAYEGECRDTCEAGTNYDNNSCETGCQIFDSCSDGCDFPCNDVPELPPIVEPRDWNDGGCTFGAAKHEPSNHESGKFTWRVFKNERDPVTGAPSFDRDYIIELHTMPVELALNGGELAPPRQGRAGLPSLIDLNGDGWLDLIKVKRGFNSHRFEVWRGFSNGTAGHGFSATAEIWPTPNLTGSSDDIREYDTNVTVSAGQRFADMNGDGLVDIVHEDSTGNLAVSYNLDGSFEEFRDLGVSGPLELSRIEMDGAWAEQTPLDAGWRAETKRLLDIDDDGLPEIVSFTQPSNGVEGASSSRLIRRFDGNPFSGTYGYLGSTYEAMERLVRVDRATDGRNRVWYRVSDYIDVTGDGRDDLVTWRANGLGSVYTDVPGPPQRLLTTINNGRGGVTQFTYAPTTDAAVVSDGWVRYAPRWVVRHVTVSPGQGQPEMRTSYRYTRPIHGSIGGAAPVFIGFASVTAESSGQAGDASRRAISDFAYTRDQRSWVRSERSEVRTGSSWTPVSSVENTWLDLERFGGAVQSRHLELAVTRTFRADGSPAGVSFVRHTWTPSAWFSTVLHHDNTETVEGIGDGTGDPLRATRRSFQLRVGQPPYAASDYRILPVSNESLGWAAGNWVRMARTMEDYATTSGLPTQTRVETEGEWARTVRTFDATGVLLTTQRPNQVAAGTAKVTRFTYGPHRLFVERTVNELGHTIIETRDVATGALLRSEGPSSRTVTAVCFLPPCTITFYEPTAWTIDGFGRTLTRSVATEPASGGGYALTPVEWMTYDDVSLPNRIVTERLRDWGGTVRVRGESHFDGIGRVIATIERSGQSGVADAVVRYTYDAGGALHVVQVPDVRVDTGAQVAHTLRRDGLGRATELLRPDGSRDVVVHDGLEQRSWTISPLDGTGAETRLIHDALGRLIEVREHDNPGPGAIASTVYQYDALDRMVRLVDADGAETRLGYDLRGQRTSVTRGMRSWFFSYDADGNLIGETSPVPGWTIPVDVLSISTYDELGRLVSHIPARRGMSNARRQELAADVVSHTYDAGANAIGQLTSVVHGRPAPAAPHWRIDYSYGLRDELRRETRTINVDYRGAVNATQWVDRTYDATGAPLDVTWDDGTTWRHVYDGRGQLAELRWLEPGVGYRSIASYTRSVAGKPRSRSSAYDQRRSWTYDVLGRVVHDRVYRPSNGATLAERDHAYDDFGRLLGVAGQIDGRLADATYGYDRRGRVTSAQVSTGYDATFSYSAGGNVTAANVRGALDTPDRNVKYRYGAVDPHAVDRLDAASGGPAVASLTYDEAGNLTTRSVAAGTWQLTWDGDDQLREASGPTGIDTYYHAGGTDRIVAIDPDGTVKLWFGESETHFVGGVPATRWHHIEAGEPVARIENRTAIELQYADTLQNLALTVSPSGAVTSSFLYGAFGELVAAAGAEGHRRQFNGMESDAATGLHFYGYRSYDPLLLRWISADPQYRVAPDDAWTEPQRANLYAFSLNNPLSYYDPDGRDGQCDANGVCVAGTRTDLSATLWTAINVTVGGVLPIIPAGKTLYDTTAGDKGLGDALDDNFVAPTKIRAEIVESIPRTPGEFMVGMMTMPSDSGAMQSSEEYGVCDADPEAQAAGPTMPGLPGRRDVVSSNGQRMVEQRDGSWSKAGPSGKPMIHDQKFSTEKKAKDAARNKAYKGGSVTKVERHGKGKKHVHPVGRDGKRKLKGSHFTINRANKTPPARHKKKKRRQP